MSGSLAATCVYECEQTGGCVAKYSGPPRSGNTIVSTQLEYLFRQTSDYSTKKWPLYCPQGSGTLRQQLLMMHGIAWYCMVLHCIA